ncbi:MAG TPA: hypothetical protein PLD46_04655 [Hyphomicrobium sp.]|nr:hypothetical protein [Hyphomicrobium sp.]
MRTLANQIDHATLSAKIATPKPVIFLIIAFLCPTEFSLYIDGLRIPPHRLALLILLPIALSRLLQQKRLKIRSFDLAFLAFNAWTVGVFMYHQGHHDGLVYGGSLALDGLGAYLVARAWVRDVAQFHAVLRAFGYAIAAAALIALPETLLGQNFTHDFLKSVTGYDHPTAVETRLGLTRAYGTFDHPIHYGTFCAALLAQFWYAANSNLERRKRAALLASATILGLSSAPILCLVLQSAMLIWEKLTRGTRNRTALTLTVLVGLYIGASAVMTRSPINLIATGMTLDSWTGFYRLQIWEHGLDNVYANPWAGIGLSDWNRPWWMASSTVDAFWLVIAMREGIPGILSLVTGVALITRAVVKRGLKQPDTHIRRLSRGWIMSMIALALIGCTVHFWNVLYAFFFFFIGSAGWIADPIKLRAKVRKTKRQRSRPALLAVTPERDYGALAHPA